MLSTPLLRTAFFLFFQVLLCSLGRTLSPPNRGYGADVFLPECLCLTRHWRRGLRGRAGAGPGGAGTVLDDVYFSRPRDQTGDYFSISVDDLQQQSRSRRVGEPRRTRPEGEKLVIRSLFGEQLFSNFIDF